MFNYVDLILIAIVLLFVITGIRKGFARTLLSFVAKVISLVVAYFVSDMYAEEVYERFLKKFVLDAIESDISSSVAGETGHVHTVLSELPSFFATIADKFGLDILINRQPDSDGISNALEQSVAGPIAVVVCRIIIFVIVSGVCSLVLDLLVNILCKIVKLPVLKTADKLFGAVLGLVNGFICVFILSFVFSIISGFIKPPEFADVINSSYIIDFFACANMLV